MLSDETAPPLSEATLSAIRSRQQQTHRMLSSPEPLGDASLLITQLVTLIRSDVPTLLLEVERLRGEVKLCVELLNLEG